MIPAAKKSLGQHFLISDGICRRIVDLADPQADDQLLEIGPGPGALTRFLEISPHKQLLLIEKDSWWAKDRSQSAETLAMDALQFDWGSLEGSWKLIGNLPYNIASPLIWDILGKCRCYSRAVFMVQKEVGERICASPDSRQYGALSVWAQCHAQTRLQFIVPPGAFRPPPKVDSAVVLFLPLSNPPEYPEQLNSLLKICFQRRRKQIGNIFRSWNIKPLLAALSTLGLDPALRPENLSCGDFLSLARLWATA